LSYPYYGFSISTRKIIFLEKNGNANITRIGQQMGRNYMPPKNSHHDPDFILGEGVSGTGEGEFLCPYGQ